MRFTGIAFGIGPHKCHAFVMFHNMSVGSTCRKVLSLKRDHFRGIAAP